MAMESERHRGTAQVLRIIRPLLGGMAGRKSTIISQTHGLEVARGRVPTPTPRWGHAQPAAGGSAAVARKHVMGRDVKPALWRDGGRASCAEEAWIAGLAGGGTANVHGAFVAGLKLA